MGDEVPDPESRNREIYNNIFTEFQRVLYGSPQLERTKFAWIADSQSKQWGEPVRSFIQYDHPRPYRLQGVDMTLKPPLAEITLPAPDQPDGTTTRWLYHLNTDGTISQHHQALKPVMGGSDFLVEKLGSINDIPLAEKEALLLELRALETVNTGL